MSPSWGRIRVASSRSGLNLRSIVLLWITQPEGSAAEWEGPAKMGLAPSESPAWRSLHCALFVTVAVVGCFNQQHLESYLRNSLLISDSL